LSGRGLCDELITRPEEPYRLCCVVCDLETSRMGAPYIYDISHLRVKNVICVSGVFFSFTDYIASNPLSEFSDICFNFGAARRHHDVYQELL